MVDECKHEWTPIDSQFDNAQWFMVKCVRCGIYGDCCMTTNEVFYPRT